MEKYIKVRKAQAEGVRTVEELKEKSDIVIDNDTEIQEIEKILQNACKCKNVSVSEVVSAVKNGADTPSISAIFLNVIFFSTLFLLINSPKFAYIIIFTFSLFSLFFSFSLCFFAF